METYKPSQMPYYIIESDSIYGDVWFAHYNTFTNIQESNEFAFGGTPQEALEKFIELQTDDKNDYILPGFENCEKQLDDLIDSVRPNGDKR